MGTVLAAGLGPGHIIAGRHLLRVVPTDQEALLNLPMDVQLQPTHLLLQLTDHIQN